MGGKGELRHNSFDYVFIRPQKLNVGEFVNDSVKELFICSFSLLFKGARHTISKKGTILITFHLHYQNVHR